MKRNLLIAILLFAGSWGTTQNSFAAPPTPTPEPKVERAEFSDLPYNHWAYPCVSKLRELFQIQPPPYVEPGLWTRYEFAIFCLRLKQDYPPLNDPTAKDTLYTLNQEFAVEIGVLESGKLVNPNTNLFESRVAPPPRLIIEPSVGNPGYRGYVGKRKFLSSVEIEDLKKEADKTEPPAK